MSVADVRAVLLLIFIDFNLENYKANGNFVSQYDVTRLGMYFFLIINIVN